MLKSKPTITSTHESRISTNATVYPNLFLKLKVKKIFSDLHSQKEKRKKGSCHNIIEPGYGLFVKVVPYLLSLLIYSPALGISRL